MLSKILLGSSLISILLLSGCIGLGPESLALANPLVKQFMSEYPNAQLTATHYSVEESAQILETLSKDCGKEYAEGKDLYRINIDDPDSGLKVVAWVDMSTQTIECAVKYGTDDEKTISDDKGEEKKCKSHAEEKCYGEHVYWFDSCGHKEDKKQYCEHGCENGFCKKIGEGCTDTDGGENIYEKGTCETGSQTLSDHCNSDGTLTEKYCDDNGEIKAETVECPEGYECSDGMCLGLKIEECSSHNEYKCYSAHVYWYNSCGVKEEKKEYCEYGCEGTECIECTSQHEYACHDGDIYWYNSCGFKEDKKEECPYGCENVECSQENLDECQTDIDCDDSIISTKDFCTGDPKICYNMEILWCLSDDGYCPSSCNHLNDNDCEESDCLLSLPVTYINTSTSVNSNIWVLNYQGNGSQVLWSTGNISVVTVVPNSGPSVTLMPQDVGSTTLTVTDNSVGPDCSVSIPIDVYSIY